MSDKRTDARTGAKGAQQTTSGDSTETTADEMVERSLADDQIADAEAHDEASTRGRAMLQGAGAGLGTLASAVGRGAGATAAKAKTVVESTSDKLETFAQQGPSGLKAETAPVAPAASTPAATAAHGTHAVRRTRKARLRVSRLDPWSVFKTILLFSVAFAIVQFIATWVLWSVFNASGALDSINKMVSALTSSSASESTNNFTVQDFINTHKVLGASAIIGVVDVILFTALATLGAFLYNLAATVLGGLELTLAED